MQALSSDHQHEDRRAGPRRGRSASVSLTSDSEIEARTSIGGATIPATRPARARPHAVAAALPSAPMRVWIDLTNSPHVLVMRPVIERAARATATRCA